VEEPLSSPDVLTHSEDCEKGTNASDEEEEREVEAEDEDKFI
jgi:hypothetical protein